MINPWKPVKAVGTFLERHKLLLLSKCIKKIGLNKGTFRTIENKPVIFY